MDYPFLLYKAAQLPPELLGKWQDAVGASHVIDHPHFQDKSRNLEAYRSAAKVDDLIAETTLFLDSVIPRSAYFWHEVNVLKQGGVLAEHSDLAYSGYNADPNKNKLETVMTHKLHVHLLGESELIFRRSKYEPTKSFFPKPGEVFWYNNYVLHSSKNNGVTDRAAISLMYHDPKWDIKLSLLQRLNLSFDKRYQY